MIIVIVPMIAVALVLFSITADSETGKADAQIAQGLRSAFAIYDSDRGAARAALARVVRDPALARALASGNRAAVAARAQALQQEVPGALRVEVYDTNRRLLAAAGRTDAVAVSVAAPSSRGRRLGYVAVSSTSGRAYVDEVSRVTGLEAHVARGTPVVASTIPGATNAPLRSGDITIDGNEYRGRVGSVGEPVGPPTRVGVLEDRSKLSSSISHRRLLIAAILG